MKRREFLKLAGVGGGSTLLAACANFKNLAPENQVLAILAVESVAIPAGVYGAKNEVADTAFRELYSLAVTGQLTPEGVNKVVDAMDVDDVVAMLMVRRILRMAQLLGANVVDGQIVDLAGLDPRLVQAAADGYVEGFEAQKASVA